MDGLLHIFKNGTTEPLIDRYWMSADGEPVRYENEDYVADADLTNVRVSVRKYEFVEQLMGDRYLTMTVESDCPIDWEKGDFCFCRGEQFWLMYIPTGKRRARKGTVGDAFVYENVKMQSIIGFLTTAFFQDYVSANSVRDLVFSYAGGFSFYVESMWDMADRLQANLDIAYPGKWMVEVREENESWRKQEVKVNDGTSIQAVLALVNSQFNQNYHVRTREAGYQVRTKTGWQSLEESKYVITIGGTQALMNPMLYYGKGNGLRSLTVNSDSSKVTLNRLHAYGSTKNLPYRYYNKHFKKLNPNGTPKYPAFWKNGVYMLDTAYIPALMLPYSDIENINCWHSVGDNFDVYVDREREEGEAIVEGMHKFDAETKYYDECKPSLECMTIDDSWVGVDAYLPGYKAEKMRVEAIVSKWYDEHYKGGITVIGEGPDGETLDYETINKYLQSFCYYNPSQSPQYTKMTTGETMYYGIAGERHYSQISFREFDKQAAYNDGVLNILKKKICDIVIKYLRKQNGIYKCIWAAGHNSHSLVMSFELKRKSMFTKEHMAYYYYYETYDGIDYVYQTKEWVKSGTYKIKSTVSSDFTQEDVAELNRLLSMSYIDNDLNVYETVALMTRYDSEMVSSIKNNTFEESGRLDKITGGSVMDDDNGREIFDNGISSDGNYGSGGNEDIEGNLMIDLIRVEIPQIGFCIEDWVIEQDAKLVMKTGMCAGREFTITRAVLKDVNDYSKGWVLGLVRTYDSEFNMLFPNRNYPIKPGDEYVITGINMPDIYVEAAERKLREYAIDFLRRNKEAEKQYVPELDNKWLYEHKDYADALATGKLFRFSDREEGDDSKDLGTGEVASMIKQLNIKYGGLIPEYSITLDDNAEPITIQTVVANEVAGIKNNVADTVIGVDFVRQNMLNKNNSSLESVNSDIEFNGKVSAKENNVDKERVNELTIDGIVKVDDFVGISTEGEFDIPNTGIKLVIRKGIVVGLINTADNG
jgi:hypothetical protein